MKNNSASALRWARRFWIVFLALTGAFQTARGGMEIGGLRCEYRLDPLGIDATEPRLSWVLKSDRGGEKQTAYRVLVASSSEKLAADTGDLWDSGKVVSGESVLVPYAGKPLVSGTDCRWKVKAWERDGAPTAWSEPARFSIGLLEKSDWQGRWIVHPDAGRDRHIYFRKTFRLEKRAEKAFVYVASLGYHELYINGIKADDSVLAPAGSRIDKRALYVTYDISDKLREGENVLSILHGPGWAGFFRAFGAAPALLVQTDIVMRDGERRSIVSDETWKCRKADGRYIGKHYGGEEFDARERIVNWNQVDFDDSGWQQASTTERNVTLSAQLVEPDRIIETLSPVGITGTGNGVYKVDMGRNFTGWFEIGGLRGKPGDRVTIRIADDPQSREDFGQVSSFICGDSPGMFRNRFNYAGGRFFTIEGLSHEPAPSDIKGFAISSDFERTGYFRCSNELLNRIYETDLWTFRANTLNGVTMDCPHRERLGYGEVSWATAWGCGLPNYRSGAFYTHMVRNWCDVQHPSGWLPHVAPQIPSPWGGTLWSSAPLTVGWETWRHYGDTRILKRAYPAYTNWMAFLDAKVSGQAEGILPRYIATPGKFLGDWAAPQGRKEFGNSREALLFNNCVYAMNLKMMIDIAATLGETDDAAVYARRLEQLRASIHKSFFDPAKKVYLDGRQVHLAFPLYVGVVPEDVRPAVVANLKKQLTETTPYLDMGSSGLPVLLHYLIEEAEWNEILYEHIAKTTRPGYGYFLEMDETAWPEYWSSRCRSKIHTCYTGVASWFIKGIGGIRNAPGRTGNDRAAVGYKHFLIKPHPVGDLTFAETKVESPYGTIVSNWRREGGKLRLEISVPVNTDATVYVPGAQGAEVRVSGPAEGVKFLRAEEGAGVYLAGSGDYVFEPAGKK